MTQLTATLQEICTLVTDGTHDTPVTLVSGVPFIKAKQIANGFIDFANCEFISFEDHLKVISRSKPEKGDTLFTHIGASLGAAAFIETNEEFSIKNIALFKPNPQKIVSRYLYYLVINHEFQDGIKNRRTGSAQPFVSLDILRTQPIRYIEDIPTQRRIAEILSAYDDLIENNMRRIRILEQMAQSVYREWFGKVTPESLPEGWKLAKVGDIINLHRGRSYGSDNLIEEGGLPFLNLKCLARDGGFRPDGLKWYKGIFKENQTAKSGDIIMAVTDMTQERRIVARAARVPNMGIDLFVMSMDLVKLSPKPDIHKTYLYAMLRFSGFADEVKQHANGANVLHLNPERIEQYQFALPPEALRNKFGEIAEPLYMQCDVLEKKNANLRRMRDLLLPGLVSGEIAVNGL